MRKEEFIQALRDKLRGLPQTDVQNTVEYYSEMLDERIEDGMDEEQAVREVGSPDEIASLLLSQTPLPRLVRENLRTRRRLRTWEIVLLVLGAPLWLPLLLSAAAVLLAVYIVLWSCVLVLYAVDLSLAACVPAAIVGDALCLQQGNTASAGLYFGVALVCAGAAIWVFFGSNLTAKGILRASRAFALFVKSRFVRKEVSA